jgi:hypothetical protein
MNDKKEKDKEIEAAPTVELPDELPPSNRKQSLVDIVGILLDKKWKDSDLKKYLEAIDNDKSVTGQIEIDRAFASKLIVDAAIEEGFAEMFKGKTLTKVRSALNLALKDRRYSTQQRLEKRKLLQNPENKSTEPT